MERTSAFGLTGDREARVLILGTHPSIKSLEQAQYYANPQNQFWRLVGAILDSELATRPYEERLDRLALAGVALSDVFVSVVRSGSSDSAIRDPENRDLRELLAKLPNLRAVACNGKRAALAGRRQLDRSDRNLVLIDLPSSSSLNTRPFNEKLAQWSALVPYLR